MVQLVSLWQIRYHFDITPEPFSSYSGGCIVQETQHRAGRAEFAIQGDSGEHQGGGQGALVRLTHPIEETHTSN